LDELLKQIPKDIFVPSSKTLFEWGLELMTAAPLPAHEFKRLETCRDYRNGLIIALLACRAPRLGSLAQMKLEKNLYKSKGEYWVRLESMIVKNRRELHYSLPAVLTCYIDRYLTEIRPLLLDLASTNAVWGNGDGGAYTYRAIGTMIFRKSAEKFKQSFGAHRFRHSFASTLATLDPKNPGVAAAVLGISEAVLNDHYRRGRQADAALKTQAHLHAERARTQLTADREFRALQNRA
jgi:integrase